MRVESQMKREQALPYVGYIADDAGSFRHYPGQLPPDGIHNAVLVGWQCGFEPMFVACKSYLPDIILDEEEAIELATEGLKEIDWFHKDIREPDYIIKPSVN